MTSYIWPSGFSILLLVFSGVWTALDQWQLRSEGFGPTAEPTRRERLARRSVINRNGAKNWAEIEQRFGASDARRMWNDIHDDYTIDFSAPVKHTS